jgi:hypothetical protein
LGSSESNKSVFVSEKAVEKKKRFADIMEKKKMKGVV